MKLRRAVYVQIVRLQKISGPASLVLLVVNLAVSAWSLLEWRGWNARVAIPSLAVLLFFTVLAVANVMARWRMYVAERGAMVRHNPAEVYAFTPFQEVMFRHQVLPALRTQAATAEATGADASELRQEVERLSGWVERGYIPYEEYPEHLRGYYLHGQGGRL